jgi:hypothetical protein
MTLRVVSRLRGSRRRRLGARAMRLIAMHVDTFPALRMKDL